MVYQFFIGCDTSKNKLNFAVRYQKEIVLEHECANSVVGVKKFIKTLGALIDFSLDHAVICLEHTGIYNHHLLKVLQSLQGNICIVSGAQIKLSLGLQRGKNDEVDARRIAEYADRFSDKLCLWQPPRQVIVKLKHLNTLRDRLVKTLNQLRTPLKEGKQFMELEDWKALKKNCHASILAIEKDIAGVDHQIEQLIHTDEYLNKISIQITSIPGVGTQTANNVIIHSNEFKDISDPRKFACQAGVAPFNNSSGSSIRGRTKVSHRANKKLKTLLHLCAMAAIKVNEELRNYYQRKVAEGKNKMCVLNAVRNKIIHRIYALVKNDVMYQKNYHFSFEVP